MALTADQQKQLDALNVLNAQAVEASPEEKLRAKYEENPSAFVVAMAKKLRFAASDMDPPAPAGAAQ